MLRIVLVLLAVGWSTAALGIEPTRIERLGKACPVGYATEGGYCIPGADAEFALHLCRPQISIKAAHPYKCEVIQDDVPVVALFDMPEENEFAVVIIRRLSEGAGASHGATAVVEPISKDVPLLRFRHNPLRFSRLGLPRPSIRKLQRSCSLLSAKWYRFVADHHQLCRLLAQG